MITLQERHSKWQALIDEQEKSGLSQAAFCKLHNLTFSHFTYYRTRFRGRQQAPKQSSGTFAPMSIAKASVTNEVRLSLPSGFQCSFPIDIDPMRVKELLGIFISC
jgi:hypothetical protein